MSVIVRLPVVHKIILSLLAIAMIALAGAARPALTAEQPPTRRVVVPYFDDGITWTEAGLFWFGRAELNSDRTPPGRNYVDLRVAYTSEELVLYANVVDYFLWYDRDATSSSDLTQYEAVGIYLDPAHDRSANPQQDDFLFLSGLCLYGCGDDANRRRQARGDGAGWDTTWDGSWTDGTWASWWCNPGPNSNECDIDFGWWSYVHVPWSTLGRSGPPSGGDVWGLGVIVYDRDDHPPAGDVVPQVWPETFSPDSPSTWGEIAFSPSPYQPEPAIPQGTTVIRRGMGESLVEDAWVGGGGTCSGGHEGDPDHDNHGSDSNLFVANQELIADFPCFSKSYLRFGLESIPPGKAILSATLTLHHWSNAKPSEAQPSYVQLFTVDNSWEEHALTWNNAPMAGENLSATWVQPLAEFPGWPGVAYDWDATQAVARAYAAGEPLSIALYSADTPFHSSKYLKSSETGDWNEEGRPKLTVLWGQPAATVDKQVWPLTATLDEVITYSVGLIGSGRALTLTDSLPDGVSAPGPIWASAGSAEYDPGQRRIDWYGRPPAGEPVIVTFPVTIEIGGPLALLNTAVLTDAVVGERSDTALAIVDPLETHLPLVVSNGQVRPRVTQNGYLYR